MSALPFGLGKSSAPAPSPDRVLLVTGNQVEELPVVSLTSEYVGTPAGDFPRNGAFEMIRPKGGRVLLIGVTLPARLEAEQVRALRKNALLHGLFHDRSNPDVTKVPLPMWLLIGGLVLGLVIVGSV